MSDIERRHTNTRLSKIVLHGGLVYLCGQTAGDSPGAGGDIAVQTREVLSRIDALLDEAGSDRSRILSAVIHLRDIGDIAAMNAQWIAWMPPGSGPARTTVEAKLAAPGLLIEVTVVAAVK